MSEDELITEIESRNVLVLEIWQDWRDATDRANELQEWYIEEKSRHAAGALAAQQDEARLTRERDEARQLAVDFRYRFEAAQKREESYAIQFALDRDNMAQLERRIAELESEKLMSDGMIVGLNVALKIKDEEIEELTPPIIEGLAL